jgi:hypothetical protein
VIVGLAAVIVMMTAVRRDDRGDGGGKRGYSPVHRRGQSPPLSPSPVKDILSPTIPSPSEKLKELEESGDSIAN